MTENGFTAEEFKQMFDRNKESLIGIPYEADAIIRATSSFNLERWQKWNDTTAGTFADAWQQWLSSPIGYVVIVNIKDDNPQKTNKAKVYPGVKRGQTALAGLTYERTGDTAGFLLTDGTPGCSSDDPDLEYLGHVYKGDWIVYNNESIHDNHPC